jgi:peroxiredoxin
MARKISATPLTSSESGSAPPTEVLNFALLDSSGKLHELRRLEAKAVVLFFTANGCPVARQSAPKLTDR